MPGPRLMVNDLVELHGSCGRRFAAPVAGVGSEQWYDETPCSEWDVRTLVHHLLYEQRWVPPLFEGLTIEQVGDRFDGDLMGDDASAWPGLLASSIEEAHAAVALFPELGISSYAIDDLLQQDALLDAVAHHMTTNPRAATEDDTVGSTMETMTLERQRHLPVVNNGELTGLISIGDVVKYRLDQIESERKALHDYITKA